MNPSDMVTQMTRMMRNRLRQATGRAPGPLSCPEVGRLLQSYLDDELDETRARAIAAHLEDCRRCGLEAETYERIIASVTAMRPEVPGDQVERLRDFGARLAAGEPPAQGDDLVDPS